MEFPSGQQRLLPAYYRKALAVELIGAGNRELQLRGRGQRHLGTARADVRIVGAEQRRAFGKPTEVDQQNDHGHRDREHLHPELERLHVGDPPHPADRDVDRDDRADDQHPDPVRRTGDDVQRQPRTLQLWHQIEASDQQHDPRGDRTDPGTAQPCLDEVGDRVGAEPAQRRGDEQQQRQVAGGEPERLPHRAGAAAHHQTGDPQEAGGGKVFTRDRGCVPPGGHRPRRDQQVRRRPREPDSPGAEPERAERHSADGEQRDQRSTRSRNWSSSASARRAYNHPMPANTPSSGTISSHSGTGMPSR